MENIELYVLYHNLFLGCLIVCIALAAIAVLIFFVLDIRDVIGYLSGRAAKRRIQKIEEESAASGRLYRKTRRNQKYEEERQSGEAGISPSAMPGARKVDHAVQSAHSAEIARREQPQPVIQGQNRNPQPEESRRPDTDSRSQPVYRGDSRDADGTTVLAGMSVTETTVLTDAEAECTSLLDGDTEQIIANGSEGTSLLSGDTEQIIANGSEGTVLLHGDTEQIIANGSEGTVLLSGDAEQISAAGNETGSMRGATEPMEEAAPAEEEKTIYGYSVRRKTTGTFKIEREIVMIHSKEII